jgi:hypothetical protein
MSYYRVSLPTITDLVLYIQAHCRENAYRLAVDFYRKRCGVISNEMGIETINAWRLPKMHARADASYAGRYIADIHGRPYLLISASNSERAIELAASHFKNNAIRYNDTCKLFKYPEP